MLCPARLVLIVRVKFRCVDCKIGSMKKSEIVVESQYRFSAHGSHIRSRSKTSSKHMRSRASVDILHGRHSSNRHIQEAKYRSVAHRHRHVALNFASKAASQFLFISFSIPHGSEDSSLVAPLNVDFLSPNVLQPTPFLEFTDNLRQQALDIVLLHAKCASNEPLVLDLLVAHAGEAEIVDDLLDEFSALFL